MSDRLTRNTWEGGLNTDTAKSKLQPIFYTAAHNLDSESDGSFFSLTNIRGTEKVRAIVNPSDTTVLGAFASKYLVDGEYHDSITLFTVTGPGGELGFENIFKIWAYDTVSNEEYELYSESIEDDYITEDRVVDAVGYAENNIDHIYFTDHYNELRYVRCEIPAVYVENFLTTSDISVQRLGANGRVEMSSITTGGSLLSGSYQFAYRMVDPVNKRFTKWSSLSLPIHVYSAVNSSALVYSDYGLPTDFKIKIDIFPSADELANFDYFQVAVVENVYPTGPERIVDGENQTFVASLLPITAVEDYDVAGTYINEYEHKTNAKIGVIPIEDLVVDLAAIQNVKTLNVKDKRLIGGNVTYHELEYDNGTPTSGGSIITRTSTAGDLFSSHDESIYRGYFRDEVYRFGIVYFDKFGNRSPVKVLDLNAITNNQISSTFPDVRFPSRSTSNSWTLFDTSSSPARLRSLGLRLSDIHNHPTWAVGFEIVRAKRIKRIISQTPVIPMTYVQGIGALGSYPSLSYTGSSISLAHEDAQPQTTDEVYLPKNLFWPDPRIIRRAGSSNTYLKRGEAKLERAGDYSLAMIFPQNFMYGDGVFTLNGSEELDIVDYVALRAEIDDSSGTAGDILETKIKANFYGLGSGDYYFDPAWSSKSLAETSLKIKNYKTFDNLAEGSTLNGKKLMDYNALLTEGVDYGFKPNIQKSVVIDVPGASHDLMKMSSKVFAGAGTKNTVASGVAIFTSNPSLVYQNSNSLNNNYINEYSGYSDGNSYVQAIKIANIVQNYEDNRYGDVDAQHEFISTGALYTFSTAELADVQAGNLVNKTVDVWGGDCFVAPHTFKIADGAYSVTNVSKGYLTPSSDTPSTLVDKWGKYFLNSSEHAISMPIGVESAAQFVTVVLESEYNGGVMADDGLIDDGSVNNIPIPNHAGTDNNRSPLTYRYNINLSKQNDQKVYFPRPEFNFVKSSFPSRVIFSDQKVYNTDIVGFDVFRVLNFLDLEEKNGSIAKLALERDSLYAIQEKAIINLPVGETQIQTTDAGQLSVGTSDFFGRPFVVDSKRGSQHIKGIVETGERIYIPDHANKAVYALAGNKLETISNINNATTFRDFFTSAVSERDLNGIYDSQRGQYWLANADDCYLFNEKRGQWVTNLEFPSGTLRGGLFMSQDLFLIGMEGEQIYVYEMYKGIANLLFDTFVTPRVSFVVNPDDPITKIYNNQVYISTERLSTVDFTVEREEELGDQTIIGTVLDTVSIRQGGNYRLKLSRATGNERLRGQRLLTTVKWKSLGNIYSSLSEVLTKYRHESRSPF